jgi:hypothetical protein
MRFRSVRPPDASRRVSFIESNLNERRITGGILVLLGALAMFEGWRLAALREEMVAGAVVGRTRPPITRSLRTRLVYGNSALIEWGCAKFENRSSTLRPSTGIY